MQVHIEQAVIDLLPGDHVRAQPDVRIDSPAAFVFVEAKRLRSSSLQPDQLAKELILTAEHGQGRHPVLLLVLGAPRPICVQGHSALSIQEAVRLREQRISARQERQVAVPKPTDTIAWTT